MSPRRTTYDMVEAKAVKLRQAGHDVQLYFNAQGHVHVHHNGEQVLVDKGRDYRVAYACLEQVGDSAPTLQPNPNLSDKDVRRGKAKTTRRKTGGTRKGQAGA